MNTEAQQNPYAPPEAEVSDVVGSDEVFEHASRGIRLGAAIIDSVIVMLVASPLAYSAFTSTAWVDDPFAIFSGPLALLSIAGLLGLIAVTIVFVHRNGQTIGKKLVGIKVVRSDGSKASLGRIFWLRNVVNGIPTVIPYVGNLYSLVDHLFIFGDKRQCLHDKIADTIVVTA